MKKNIFILTILLLIPTLVIAQGQGQAQGQGNGVQQRLQDPVDQTTQTDVTGYQNQNQNQVENQGDETQLQNQFQEEEAEDNKIKGGVNRSDNARTKMSAVAQKVEELLNDPTLEGGIGPQIKEFAQAQRQVQDELEVNETKLQNRNKIARVLFGPDYKAIDEMKGLLERNEIRIRTLTELANQVENEAELAQITETVQLLTEQNTALAEQIALEENQPGILGWFFKLFAK